MAYIDARDVMNRLDDIVPGAWETAYEVREVKSDWIVVECQLTVQLADKMHRTRADVGEGGAFKDAYSDALKRAAVQFGIGRFLYDFPQVKARAHQYGKSWYLTKQTERDLFVLVTAMLAGDAKLPELKSLQINNYFPFVKGVPL